MISYEKEIPGSKHTLNGDSHYSSPKIIGSSNNVWQFFMVADGCSGYNQTIASHMIIKSMADYLENELVNSKDTPENLLRNGIIEGNKGFESIGGIRSTLDVVLISNEISKDLPLDKTKIYVAHLGDSKVYLGYNNKYDETGAITQKGKLNQVTKNEVYANKKKGPSNYLGPINVDGVPLTERITIIDLSEEKPDTIFLTTDGLEETLSNTDLEAEYLNPEYSSPQQFLTKLVDRVKNNGQKYDDTTMIYVDLKDKVESRLSYLQKLDSETIPELEQQLEKNQQRLDHSENERKILEEEEYYSDNLRYQNDLIISSLDQRLETVNAEKLALQNSLDSTQRDYNAVKIMLGLKENSKLGDIENLIDGTNTSKEKSVPVWKNLGTIIKKILDYDVEW